MFTAIGVVICTIWIIIEECKKKPSKLYVFVKEFSLSPAGQEFASSYRRSRNNKKTVKALKKQRKKQNRQVRNLIVAHYCIKKVDKFTFGNTKRRY